jgi:hypothetical protein
MHIITWIDCNALHTINRINGLQGVCVWGEGGYIYNYQIKREKKLGTVSDSNLYTCIFFNDDLPNNSNISNLSVK